MTTFDQLVRSPTLQTASKWYLVYRRWVRCNPFDREFRVVRCRGGNGAESRDRTVCAIGRRLTRALRHRARHMGETAGVMSARSFRRDSSRLPALCRRCKGRSKAVRNVHSAWLYGEVLLVWVIEQELSVGPVQRLVQERVACACTRRYRVWFEDQRSSSVGL